MAPKMGKQLRSTEDIQKALQLIDKALKRGKTAELLIMRSRLHKKMKRFVLLIPFLFLIDIFQPATGLPGCE